MAAFNIVKVLRGRLRQSIKDLYERHNRKNTQYLVYDVKHINLLTQNTVDNFIKRDAALKRAVLVKNPAATIDKVVKQKLTKSKIQKEYERAGFKFVTEAQGKKAAKGNKVAYFGTDTGVIKIFFPTPESRAEKRMSKIQKRAPLPNVYDNVAKKGPNNNILTNIFTDAVIAVAQLKTTKRGRDTIVTLPDGTTKTMSQFKAKSAARAVKLHGGDTPLIGQTVDPLIGNANPEGTTARVVDAIEQMKSGKLKAKVDKLAGKILQEGHFEEGLEAVLEAFDATFTINSTTVSDIVENKKEIVIGHTMGDKDMQKLMEKGDAPGLRELYSDIENFVLEFVGDPESRTSDSMKKLHTDRAAQAIIKGIFSGPLTKKGTPDMRFKANKALLNKKGKKTQTSAEFKEQFAKLTETIILSKTKSVSGKGKFKTSGKYNPRNPASDTSLAALMQMVNKALPRHLKRNMEPPALQYRGLGNPSKPFAGPFNRGVRVQSIRDFKDVQGGLDIQYTYEKYPYQTFEPGFEKGSVLRDPRKLIEESIRDIMIERKQTRFLNMRRI